MTTCTTCKGKGEVELLGPRDCFVPRDGWVFCDVDYAQLELRTLAEVCYEVLGRSAMGDLFRSDPEADPHCMVAAQIVGCSYEEAKARYKDKDPELDDARQAGKVADFGFPGGLGAKRFCHFAYKSYGVKMRDPESGEELDPDDERAWAVAAELKEVFMSTWPEMREYFAWVRSLRQHDDTYAVTHPVTGVVRSNMTYTQCCNSPFQHLGAYCTKEGLWLVTRECYLPGGPLHGARVVNVVHDQLLTELPSRWWGPDRTHEAANLVSYLFARGAGKYLKRVPISCEPVLSTCWSKKAKPVYDEEGRLSPWHP